MLEIKEQKRYLATIAVLIIILGLISFWNRPDFRYRDTNDYSKLKEQSQIDEAAYQRYLSALKVDPKASKNLFQEILTEKEIREEVAQALQTGRPLNVPQIKEAMLQSPQRSGQDAVVEYLAKILGPAVSFNKKTKDLNANLFSSDPAAAEAINDEFEKTFSQMVNAPVPREAMALRKALVTAYAAYGRLLETSRQYSNGGVKEPWPNVYQDYVVINDNLNKFNGEFKKLSDKYKLAELPPIIYHDPLNAQQPGFHFIKTAHALFGLGDLTITVGDIPSLVKEAVEEGLRSSFLQFMGSFLEKVISKIEKNYLIANFLYYSDALVAGQYADDYLNKYVEDGLDRQVIKKLLPQFSCYRGNEELKPVFKAKAQEYLGFNPASVSPQDPEYYQKMSRVGSFLASPEGWQLRYEDLANQVKAESEKAVERELASSGLKTPRDTIQNSISQSISGIVSAQRASFSAVMQLGISNAASFVSKFVAQMTQVLVNKFVFRGVVAENGSIAVFKEQPTCLAAAQMQLVLPAEATVYQEPPPVPDKNQLLNQECARLPRGCDIGATSTRP